MAVQLSTTSSIVDFLGTQNKDSSFSARKKLYNEMGLNARLGDYVGSSAQNTNFLNALKTPTPAPESPFVPGNSPLKAPETPVATNTINTISQPVAQPAVQQANTITPPPVQTPQPTTATETLGTFGYTPPAPPTPEEVMAKAQATPEYKLAEEGQDVKTLAETALSDAKKQGIQAEYETNVDKIENDYNLSFSGARGKALETLTTNLATSMLGADRELAIKLLESDVNAREKFLGIVKDVISGAAAGDKTNLEQMNKLGYAVVDGQVLPIPQKADFSSIKSAQGGLYDLNTGQWVVAPKPGSDGGLTTYQQGQAFLRISDKYQADSIINQAIKGQTAVAIADQVIANPNSATSQLKSLYILVKNLDPDSAVREGELALANQTQSYLDKFKNTLARLDEGRVIAPDAAKALAEATKELAVAWNATAARRQQQYKSQADVAGVGDQFGGYLGGYQSEFGGGTGGILTSPDGSQEVDISGLTPEEIQEAKDLGWQ